MFINLSSLDLTFEKKKSPKYQFQFLLKAEKEH